MRSVAFRRGPVSRLVASSSMRPTSQPRRRTRRVGMEFGANGRRTWLRTGARTSDLLAEDRPVRRWTPRRRSSRADEARDKLDNRETATNLERGSPWRCTEGGGRRQRTVKYLTIVKTNSRDRTTSATWVLEIAASSRFGLRNSTYGEVQSAPILHARSHATGRVSSPFHGHQRSRGRASAVVLCFSPSGERSFSH